jgi:hypothetical protein
MKAGRKSGALFLERPGNELLARAARKVSSQLHDDREVSRVKSFFSHAPINGDGRLIFQTAANTKCASSNGGSQGLECLLLGTKRTSQF